MLCFKAMDWRLHPCVLLWHRECTTDKPFCMGGWLIAEQRLLTWRCIYIGLATLLSPHYIDNLFFYFVSQTCGPNQCSRYTACITCLYGVVDGVLQKMETERCNSICEPINATIIADTFSGLSNPRLSGTITCRTGLLDGQCSGISFSVKSDNGSAVILVSTSLTRECNS